MIRYLLILLLAGSSIAATATAEGDTDTVSFSAPSKVGSVVLPPGLYRLKIQGSLVFFTDIASKKSFSALVKVEKLPKKSAFTAAQARNTDGGQQVESIVVQGADYKLVF